MICVSLDRRGRGRNQEPEWGLRRRVCDIPSFIPLTASSSSSHSFILLLLSFLQLLPFCLTLPLIILHKHLKKIDYKHLKKKKTINTWEKSINTWNKIKIILYKYLKKKIDIAAEKKHNPWYIKCKVIKRLSKKNK